MKEITPQPHQLQKVSQVDALSGKPATPTGTPGAFEKLLAEELKAQAKQESAEKTLESLPEIHGSFQAEWVLVGFDRAGFTQELSDAVDLLDTYATVLADPDKTLKQAWEQLTVLSDQTSSLKTQMDKALQANPDQVDHDLVQMLNQLMTTLRVEEIKLNRGDYSNLA